MKTAFGWDSNKLLNVEVNATAAVREIQLKLNKRKRTAAFLPFRVVLI